MLCFTTRMLTPMSTFDFNAEPQSLLALPSQAPSYQHSVLNRADILLEQCVADVVIAT